MNTLTEEQWRNVRNFEGLYEVSNMGRLRRVAGYVKNGKTTKKYVECHIKIPYVNNKRNGYIYYMLYKNNKLYTRQIHRLVAEAFIPNPNNLPQVNHIDGNKDNNTVNNLEWCSDIENKRHAWKHGLYTSDHKKQKIKCLENGHIYNSVIECSQELSIDRRSVFRQLKGNLKHVKGYTFTRV